MAAFHASILEYMSVLLTYIQAKVNAPACPDSASFGRQSEPGLVLTLKVR
jgi:hypothetical protein